MKKSNPILFLDIDGPLTSARTHIALEPHKMICRAFDPVSVGMIKRICREFNVLVVVSSTWRHLDNRKTRKQVLGEDCSDPLGNFDLRQHLRDSGLTVNFHEDWKTPASRLFSTRGMQVRDWLEDHPEVTNYICLDDDIDFADDMIERLVKCDSYNGMSYQNYLEARKLLSENV
jgi:hypothetical protein